MILIFYMIAFPTSFGAARTEIRGTRFRKWLYFMCQMHKHVDRIDRILTRATTSTNRRLYYAVGNSPTEVNNNDNDKRETNSLFAGKFTVRDARFSGANLPRLLAAYLIFPSKLCLLLGKYTEKACFSITSLKNKRRVNCFLHLTKPPKNTWNFCLFSLSYCSSVCALEENPQTKNLESREMKRWNGLPFLLPLSLF